MNGKKLWLFTLVLVLLLSGCSGMLLQKTDVSALDYSGGELPPLEELLRYPQLEVLDLRDTGMTVQEYEEYARQLPDCRILWSVPFQGKYLPQDTTELTVTSLTPEDVELLRYFPELRSVDARDCGDPAMAALLQQTYPNCTVRYQVTIGQRVIDSGAEELVLSEPELREAAQVLGYLPKLRSVTIEGSDLETGEVEPLLQACPEAEFHWNFSLCGVSVSSDDREVDLSGVPMESVETVEDSLGLFNHLEKVIMCDCGISSEEMDALWKRHPEVRFVWNISLGKASVRTDITALIPFKYGYSGSPYKTGDDLLDRDCTEMKYLVDLVCLDLGHMSIRDLSFLEYMPNMEYLLLCDNGIRDITPIGGLKKLKYLEIFNNPITDISVLEGCTALEDLNATYNPVEDVTVLQTLPNLKNLWMTAGLLTKEQVAWLEAEFSDINLQLYTGRSTAAGWRELPNYFKQRDLLDMWYMTTP